MLRLGVGDINGDIEVSGHGAWVRVRTSCSVKSTGMIGLQLKFGSVSAVRSMARLSFRIMVRHKRHCC